MSKIVIELEDDNAVRVAAWVAHFLFEDEKLPDYCGEDFAPLLDQIDTQSSVFDAMECQGQIEWDHPSRSNDRIFG
jgi:hypothetical protein